MKSVIFKYVTLMLVITFFTFCKKKTDIKITVFNPYIQKNVKNAKISIVELHKSNFFTSGWGKMYDDYKEIASGFTDENGVMFFQKEKLKSNSKYDYAIRLTETWGIKNTTFDPSSHQNLSKGKTNDIIVSDYTKGTVNIQFSNLFIPVQSGDSICILPKWYDLFDPQNNNHIKGEGIEKIYMPYDLVGNLPSNYAINGYPDHACGKVLLTIRKRKLGVLTLDTLTVQFYPQQTTVIPINW